MPQRPKDAKGRLDRTTAALVTVNGRIIEYRDCEREQKALYRGAK